jgi:hypothetical protein
MYIKISITIFGHGLKIDNTKVMQSLLQDLKTTRILDSCKNVFHNFIIEHALENIFQNVINVFKDLNEYFS